MRSYKHAQKDSNPHCPELKSGVLPITLWTHVQGVQYHVSYIIYENIVSSITPCVADTGFEPVIPRL